MVFTYIYIHILVKTKLKWKKILLLCFMAIGYRNTAVWLLFMYLLFIYLFQRLKQAWKMIICSQGFEVCELAAQVIAFCLEAVHSIPAPFAPLTQFDTLESDKNFAQCLHCLLFSQ